MYVWNIKLDPKNYTKIDQTVNKPQKTLELKAAWWFSIKLKASIKFKLTNYCTLQLAGARLMTMGNWNITILQTPSLCPRALPKYACCSETGKKTNKLNNQNQIELRGQDDKVGAEEKRVRLLSSSLTFTHRDPFIVQIQKFNVMHKQKEQQPHKQQPLPISPAAVASAWRSHSEDGIYHSLPSTI